MMDSNDNLQSRLDRIRQWKIFDIDWAHWRNMVVGSIEDLCALSVGVDPESPVARLLFVTELLLPSRQKETAYENIVEWIKRVRVAKRHVAVGLLPIVQTAAPPGEHDPDKEAQNNPHKIFVRIADFVAWATSLPDPWELPEEMKRMGSHPEEQKKWTPEKLAELRAFRDEHGTKAAAKKFGISEARVRQLLPKEPPSQIASALLMPEKRTMRRRKA
ncbi:MAG: hypothetical protein K6T56_01430 [Burkholderiales bacterium]|nr:hypothetical protein [Burkholderiales bacterium]